MTPAQATELYELLSEREFSLICGIYRIFNSTTSKCYVGSSKNIWKRCLDSDGHLARLKENRHHSAKLQASWNKHGSEVFRFEILEVCSEEQLFLKEAFWMAKLDSVDTGYNVRKVCLLDGKITHSHSEETKAKMSAKATGRTLSQEVRDKISKSKSSKPLSKAKPRVKIFGRVHSEESRKLMSEATKGRKHSQETKDKLSRMNLGKHHTEETKKKISEFQLNRPTASQETKKKLTEANLAYWKNLDPETREKRRQASIKAWERRRSQK